MHAVFESILDWDSFSLRVRESALEAVPQLLEAVAPERLARMQRNLARVWHRCGVAGERHGEGEGASTHGLHQQCM